mmetsp:Transcript_82493/g.237202  ORF Transcript_82493/g.237202 Transcript_82493/m.237202 type:complete len:235 (+) Transcript_82493:644-1348(+)
MPAATASTASAASRPESTEPEAGDGERQAAARTAKNSAPRSCTRPSAVCRRMASITASAPPILHICSPPSGKPSQSAASATAQLACNSSARAAPPPKHARMAATSGSTGPTASTTACVSLLPWAKDAKTTAAWQCSAASCPCAAMAATTALGAPALQRASCWLGPNSNIIYRDRRPRIWVSASPKLPAMCSSTCAELPGVALPPVGISTTSPQSMATAARAGVRLWVLADTGWH